MTDYVTTTAMSTDGVNWYEGGVQVFPCRCGVIHRGTYAQEDWNHHNCLHAGPLVLIDQPGTPDQQAMCMDCGNAWGLAEVSP